MGHENILIVDDEESVLEYCGAALEGAGYNAVTVAGGEEAIERASTERFGLLLADVKMVPMDGLTTFRAIKEFDPDIAGIAMTGYGSLENAVQALQLGFSWFLTKPFTVDELTSAVERTLENVRLAGENARLKALVNLHELAQTSGQHANLDALLTTTLHVALKETGAEGASVALGAETPGGPMQRVCVPPTNSESGPVVVAEEFIARQVAQMGSARTFVAGGVESGVAEDLMRAAGLAASVCVPLMSAGDVIGTLTVHKYQRNGATRFSDADCQAATVIGAHAAIAISNVQLRQRLEGGDRQRCR